MKSLIISLCVVHVASKGSFTEKLSTQQEELLRLVSTGLNDAILGQGAFGGSWGTK